MQVLNPPMTGISAARVLAFLELTKPRLTSLVLFTTFVGFYLGGHGAVPFLSLLHTLIGTALVAGGASAMNMCIERRQDALMLRTAMRPLPSGRLQASEAACFALLLCALGIAWLYVQVNPLTSWLGVTTLAAYLFMYTPLKRKTWLCTLAGALPGALPTLMGWAAAQGHLTPGAGIPFLIVFLWQLPHFYAIGWIYRDEYARAGFQILAVVDPQGTRTSRQIRMFQIALCLSTAVPIVIGAGLAYFAGAALLDSVFIASGSAFARKENRRSAVRLFRVSLFFLPALLTLLLIGVPR